jgi:hypothetical protein
MDLEPLLPVELEREIFEMTAQMYPHEIPILLRVARRFLIWLAFLQVNQLMPI